MALNSGGSWLDTAELPAPPRPIFYPQRYERTHKYKKLSIYFLFSRVYIHNFVDTRNL